MPTAPVVNVPDVALVFEGGGMRAAYTSAVVVALVEAGLVFPFVAGISAGASNTVNYLTGDAWRDYVKNDAQRAAEVFKREGWLAQ